MSESLAELKNQWKLAHAATVEWRGEQRLKMEIDPHWQRETMALGVRIAELEQAEAARPQMSQTQREQLAWLDRVEGATDKAGVRLAGEMSARGTAYRKTLHESRTRVMEGADISNTIAATERDAAANGWHIGAPRAPESRRFIPSNEQIPSGGVLGGPINTQRSPSVK